MEFKNLIRLTLLTNISSCVAVIIYYSLTQSPAMGMYAGMMTFGNILLPTLIAVMIFLFIKRSTSFRNTFLTIMLQFIILLLIFIFGLLVWSAIDSYLFKTLTWENIMHDYQTQFSGFLPVVITEAILIPIFDWWFVKSAEAEVQFYQDN